MITIKITIFIVVVWTLLFFNIENDFFFNYIFIFIVIVPGVNGLLDNENIVA